MSREKTKFVKKCTPVTLYFVKFIKFQRRFCRFRVDTFTNLLYNGNVGFSHKGEFMIFENSSFNFSSEIGKGALLTAVLPSGELNTMTVSWGQAGVLWNKSVCTVYVRPQRHTFGFCEGTDVFSLSFFGEEFKDVLAYCGTKSGRDVDKFKECNLGYTIKDGTCVFDGARATLILKKLYAQDLKADCFTDKAPLSNYKANDFHRAYTCEITDIIIK